ncbi:phage minor capsid protein [Streptomyces sp. SLBN-115]|uniref:phage minor capsid protein n=1 Tax=Streptomyces sp. SLBN-115 TaxID=2768453 RepID=UPI001F39374B|nr:phage minor capsid protein [Streptomyces sp. SLBN-115]
MSRWRCGPLSAGRDRGSLQPTWRGRGGPGDRVADAGGVPAVPSVGAEDPDAGRQPGRADHRDGARHGGRRDRHRSRRRIAARSPRPAGLLHPNCRHDISAYLPGVSKVPAPQPSRGTYEDSQKHRYLERQVRRWKRGEQTALDEQQAKAARVRTREYQARIRELVKETGLPRKAHREQLATAR